MRTLLLLRHAKSSWEDSSLDDHERPLESRGRRAAPAIGAWLAREGPEPELVLCSDAARAMETWELVAAELGSEPRTVLEPAIYGADEEQLLELVHEAPPEIDRLMLVGHNPGFHDLAIMLVGKKAKGRDAKRLHRKMPTAALVVLELPGDDWASTEPGTATLRRFVRPKDLPGARKLDL
jgi:phosphohistidine phosphatase